MDTTKFSPETFDNIINIGNSLMMANGVMPFSAGWAVYSTSRIWSMDRQAKKIANTLSGKDTDIINIIGLPLDVYSGIRNLAGTVSTITSLPLLIKHDIHL